MHHFGCPDWKAREGSAQDRPQQRLCTSTSQNTKQNRRHKGHMLAKTDFWLKEALKHNTIWSWADLCGRMEKIGNRHTTPRLPFFIEIYFLMTWSCTRMEALALHLDFTEHLSGDRFSYTTSFTPNTNYYVILSATITKTTINSIMTVIMILIISSAE